MPSLRPTRRSSRTSSPLVRNTNDSPVPASVSEPKKERGQTLLDGWVEPPLKSPTASFEEYGFVRQGVLEHMAPLGALPSAKLKAKLRGDSHKRSNLGKNGIASAVEEGTETPEELTPPVDSRRSESPKPEERLPELPVNKAEEQDDDYVPNATKSSSRAAKGAKKSEAVATEPRRASAASTSHGIPTSRTPFGRKRLQVVVEAAVERAKKVGNPNLGLAVRHIFEESLHDQSLADLLDVILAKRPTPEQTLEFQEQVRRAKKIIKSGEASKQQERPSLTPAPPVSATPPKSPPKTTLRIVNSATLKNSIPNPPPQSNNVPLSTLRASRSSTTMQAQPIINDETTQVNGASSLQPPRRSRSSSLSSESSLSSVSSTKMKELEEDQRAGLDEDLLSSSRLNAATSAKANTGSRSMDTVKSQALFGLKLHHKASSKKSAAANALKRSAADAGITEEESAELEAKRQRYVQSFSDIKVKESHIRDIPVVDHSTSVKQPMAAPLAAVPSLRPNGIEKRFGRNGFPELASPLSDNFALGSAASSRPDTPGLLARPAKRQKIAARTKMSPVKSSSAVVAGKARVDGARHSPVGYDDSVEVSSDNNDFCSACGGTGFLLCCDGCNRSFHFTCCDPPLNPDASQLDEPWFCSVCEIRRSPPPKHTRGLFAMLLSVIARQNTTAFEVPEAIRDYFEGVKTGPEGEYEEDVVTIKQGKSRTSYEDHIDATKLRDTKNNVMLCAQCGGSQLNRQQLIQCDICTEYWHLDCLDPPLANPPPRPSDGKPRHAWVCPRHVAHDLRALENIAVSDPLSERRARRTHKLRRPKNPKVVDVMLRRGYKNNGIIEVASDSESDDDLYDEKQPDGEVYRLPSRGIKLDFIDKIKGSRFAQRQKLAASARLQANLSRRSMKEQKTVVSLAQLAQKEGYLALGLDAIQTLVLALTSESTEELAASNETARASRSPPAPPSPPHSDKNVLSEEERGDLLRLQELIRRRLEAGSD